MTSKLPSFTEFSVIDLKDAFLQIPVKEHSRKALVIAIHRGYLRYKSLPYGLNISPLIFQCYMDTLLHDIGGVAWYQGDIVLGGKTRQVHLNRLHCVLVRLQSVGLMVQERKLPRCFSISQGSPFLFHITNTRASFFWGHLDFPYHSDDRIYRG